MTSLVDQFLAAINGSMEWNKPLQRLLEETKARAVGAWEIRGGDRLVLTGFTAVADMDPLVVAGFAQATGDVSLDQTQFGIVQAVRSDGPVFATHDNRSGTLPGSASWIGRFGAAASLAMPIHHRGSARLAIAMSTSMELAADQPPASFLIELVNSIEKRWGMIE